MRSDDQSTLRRWLKRKCTPLGESRVDEATNVELVDRVLALTGGVQLNWGEAERSAIAVSRVRRDADSYDGSSEQLAEIREEEEFLSWAKQMDEQDRADDWSEEDHPRDESGKFGEGGGKADKKSKDPLVMAHAKVARDHAKQAVEHAQTVRAALKKDPSNAHLQELSKKADNTAKAARSAARKSEQAGSEKEAAKHAMAAGEKSKEAAGHVEKAKEHAAPKATSKPVAPPVKETPKTNEQIVQELSPTASQEKTAKDALAKISLEKSKAAFDASNKIFGASLTHEEKVKAHEAASKLHAEAHAAGVAAGFASTQTTNKHAQQELHHAKEAKKEPPPPGVVPSHEFEAMRKEYTAKLDANEKKAALLYSGNAYTTINSALRAGQPHSVTTHLDAAIAKAPAPKELTVFRGSGDHNGMFSSLKPGDKFTDKAYISTSSAHAMMNTSVKFVITVPKGAHAAPIPSHHAGEKEFLLPRNTTFRITKSEKSPSGHGHVIHMTMEHK